MVKVSVKDSGIGIEESELNKITSFGEESDHNRKVKGMGLRLFVIKEICKFLSGQIMPLQIKSKLGEGSKFTFYLKDFALENEQRKKASPCLLSQHRELQLCDCK